MPRTFQQEGDLLPWTNSTGAAVAAGTAVLIGSKVGFVQVDTANGATGTVFMEGVHLYAKNTGAGTGGAMGVKAYWDNTNKRFTAVSSGNTEVGYFAAACADGDATCYVKLLG